MPEEREHRRQDDRLGGAPRRSNALLRALAATPPGGDQYLGIEERLCEEICENWLNREHIAQVLRRPFCPRSPQQQEAARRAGKESSEVDLDAEIRRNGVEIAEIEHELWIRLHTSWRHWRNKPGLKLSTAYIDRFIGWTAWALVRGVRKRTAGGPGRVDLVDPEILVNTAVDDSMPEGDLRSWVREECEEAGLTPEEIDTVWMLMQNFKKQEIAAEYGRSPSFVTKTLQSIKAKFNRILVDLLRPYHYL